MERALYDVGGSRHARGARVVNPLRAVFLAPLLSVLPCYACASVWGFDDLSLTPSDASVASIVDGDDTAADAAPSSPDAAEMTDATPCLTDLSGIGTSDFRVSFNLQTTATGATTLVYQRAVCAHGAFWDIHLLGGNYGPSGHLGVETDDNAVHYAQLQSVRSINDGAVHAIVVARVSEILTITIDGVLDSSTSSLTNFGPLPPLGFASGDPCEAEPSGESYAPLAGGMTALCIESL